MAKEIYTMPAKFIEDNSVPVKWRLYGLLNGFWVNGLTVYASSKFFSEKLGCSERWIRGALEELEKDGLLRREIKGHSRTILPGGKVTDPEVGVPRPGSGSSGEAEVGVPPNASSNASSLIGATREEVVETSEEEPKSRKESRVQDKLAIYNLFSSKEEPWWRHAQQKQAALSLFDLVGVESVKNGLKLMRENADDKYCPQASTPFEYEEKRERLKRYLKNYG